MADPQTAHFVLVPGFWLGAWAWQRVAEELVDAGHTATALTLPGLQADDTDRAGIGMEHHAAAVADAIRRSPRPPVLVAHSGAGAVASVVLDRHPDSVRRVVYVDSGPAPDGWYDPSVPADAVEIPLPAWEDLRAAGASLDGLSVDDLAEFRTRAVPHPARVAREPLRLDHDVRRKVPTTVIACSISADALREMAAEGHPMFAEVAELADLSLLDLPTGHWPMFSKPHELALALAATAR